LPNIQIFACEIVKNYPRWGQFSLRRLLPPRLLGRGTELICKFIVWGGLFVEGCMNVGTFRE
jgi:hypothetical protein